MPRVFITNSLLAAVLLSGCATTPMGPTALVMPAQGKPFEAFAQDQAMCKQFADHEVGGGATMSNLRQFGTAAVSAALGAGLGAAVRGTRGAEIGGAVGSIGGAMAGGMGSGRDQNGLQGRYNLAYTQCMYAQGNQIGNTARPAPRVASAAPGGYPQPMQSDPGYSPGPGYLPVAFNPFRGHIH